MKATPIRFVSVFIAAGICAAAVAQSRSTPSHSLTAEFSHACTGTAVAIDLRFDDSNGYSNEIIRKGQLLAVYREREPESLDWRVNDMYLFSIKTGQRLHFSRAVTYVEQIFEYVLVINSKGQRLDNESALPKGQYLTDEPILTSLKEFCRLRPVKAY